jgi:hypothetical protein
MSLELTILIAMSGLLIEICALLFKAIASINKIENRTIETSVKLEYVEKSLIKLDREFSFEIKNRNCRGLNNDND